MEIISAILSILIYGIVLFFIGYGIYKLIVYIKHKRKKKKEGID